MDTNNSFFLTSFFKLESAGGIVLFIAAVLAIIVANSPLATYYQLLLSAPIEIRLGGLEIAKPLLLWVNDGLMAIFFFLIGLELKRELLEGELSDKRNVILPGIGALGGMAAPALIYLYFTSGDAVAARGWAIPAATDIAFALGVLSLLGSRVPISIKIFLTSLAIFDDIGAIAIIAFFYTSEISFTSLAIVGACVPVLWLMNKRNLAAMSPYILVGIILWVAMLKSGIHATLAGVLLAMFIPLKLPNLNHSPLRRIEHDLHSAVAFIILPIFAFANAGVGLLDIQMNQLLHGVPIGIAFGLFFGKQIGIFSLCWLAVKCKIVSLPDGMNWTRLYGTTALCGIGFTMSLFIGSLAFEGLVVSFDERLGIILGSLISGLLGYFVLKKNLAQKEHTTHADTL